MKKALNPLKIVKRLIQIGETKSLKFKWHIFTYSNIKQNAKISKDT